MERKELAGGNFLCKCVEIEDFYLETLNTQLAFPNDKLILTNYHTRFGTFQTLEVACHFCSANCPQLLLCALSMVSIQDRMLTLEVTV